ncbi:MAG: SDR family oxidoreductase [Candidatus Marinimicrobia bacterium]|nr:SDR family oxidoreductase [Candidatus Neomarinimicrobiota bacterium]MCF7922163.1 SDR family oxidoreductase [Candidatus Neomarinimicrobiota bacterium]
MKIPESSGIRPNDLILLTGATGYVGGRLLRELEKRGQHIRCMARRPENLRSRANPQTEVIYGDVLDQESLIAAMDQVKTAYYLVHSMGSKASFEETDRQAAINFGAAARASGVERIIYLGGLGNQDKPLSPHLRSRQEVGDILRESGVPVIEFRASIVLGSGSLSFEMIRSLVERLPIMITPRWVSSPAQPIAIEDLIAYLMEGLDLAIGKSRIYEIGGADQVSYADLMRVYASHRGLRIRMLPVPVLTPLVSSLWLGLITPLYARIGRKLVESIVHSTVVRDKSALQDFQVVPMGVNEAMQQALDHEDHEFAITRWSDSLSSAGDLPTWGGVRFGTRLVDSRTMQIALPPQIVYRTVAAIGGETGWYAYNWLWQIRGFLDMLIGGVGMRRDRPAFRELEVGDTVDFWRVEAIEPDRRLRFIAEMKLPGRAWLEFEVTGDAESSTLRQTAVFDPRGLFGQLYWYGIYPLHQLVFKGMIEGLASAALSQNQDGTS